MSKGYSLIDRLGRRATTLRVSLTDRCNFRCVYCMPPEGMSYQSKSDQLTIDELARIVRITGALGVSRYRLTGGEPLLRPDIVAIVEQLRGIDTVEELSITTNASLLEPLAKPLRTAGLDRLNISLDSLDPERFSEVARSRKYLQVQRGIEAAIDAGFPVKINVVVMAGMTDREICDFVRMAVDRSIEVRFLEFMPLCGSAWQATRVLPIPHVRRVVRAHFELVERPRADNPAETFDISGGGGRVGFIAPLSEPFCENCSRIRITAHGRLRPCLFSDSEFDLLPLLRGTGTDAQLADALRTAVWNKPPGSQFNDAPFEANGSRDAAPCATHGPLIRSIGG